MLVSGIQQSDSVIHTHTQVHMCIFSFLDSFSLYITIKGLDLIDRVSEELWTEACDLVQEAGIKTIPNKKKC